MPHCELSQHKSKYSVKEKIDKAQIISEVKKSAARASQDLQLHYVYAGNYYNSKKHAGKLHDWICLGLQEYKIRNREFKIDPLMVTMLRMIRNNVISKVRVDVMYYGPKNAALAEAIGIERQSINDDLLEFYEKILLGEEMVEGVSSYFLPMMTEKDIKLVRTKNEDHLRSYFLYYSDEDHEQMHPEIDFDRAASELESSYVQVSCYRYTSMIIENPARFPCNLL